LRSACRELVGDGRVLKVGKGLRFGEGGIRVTRLKVGMMEKKKRMHKKLKIIRVEMVMVEKEMAMHRIMRSSCLIRLFLVVRISKVKVA